MLKKIITVIMIILILIGCISGIYLFSKDDDIHSEDIGFDFSGLYNSIQTKTTEIDELFVYGKSLNMTISVNGISKDNFENAKLYMIDENGTEKIYNLDGTISDNKLTVTSSNLINSGLILDDLELGNYMIFLRLKMNNSVNPKIYSIIPSSKCENIEYYSITKNGENKKITIDFDEKEYNNKEIKYVSIRVENEELPSGYYDVVIDAGHGGKDQGEKLNGTTEADLCLEYAKLLKEKLEAQDIKVKLTRDDLNNDTYTYTNMYDENGRISIACKSNAKLMISLHVNNGANTTKGLEIYCPCKSNLDFAKKMASNIISYTDIEYSNNNSYKQADGVYVRNFTEYGIEEYSKTAKKNGYEPYNITLDTPYLYTIREVGGIATNAFVDGRNTKYSANKYYKSNKGIECYQIEMGYIKNDLDLLKNQMNEYVTAIFETIINNY